MNAQMINEEVAGSFWHRVFAYHKYMEENMPFSNVDVEAGRHGKLAELVQDAGMFALRSLLLVHSMEGSTGLWRISTKIIRKDLEKYKHKVHRL